MMQEFKEFFAFLLNEGLVYRYSKERFAELAGGGQPYPSLTKEVVTNGETFIEELIQPALIPVFLSEREVAELERIADVFGKFLKAQMEIFKMAKEEKFDDSLCRLIRQMCTESEWNFGLVDSGYREILPFMRLDCLRTKNGFLVVDINSTRPAGVGDCILLAKTYQEFGVGGASFLMEECFIETVKNCVEEWGKNKFLPESPWNILVRQSDGDWHNFRILTDCLNKAGFSARVATEDPADLIHNHPVIIRSRIKEGDPLFIRLQEKYPNSACIISPLYRRFLGNKIWMYLIRLPEVEPFFEERLGKEDFDFLKRIFPEVGIMKEGRIRLPSGEAVDLTVKNRKEWVIKQPAGSSAQKMIFGLMEEKSWEYLMLQNFDGCLAQRFYKVMEKFPVVGKNGEIVEENFFTKYGVFILGGELAGCEVMIRRHHIVHGARNTYFSSCFMG